MRSSRKGYLVAALTGCMWAFAPLLPAQQCPVERVLPFSSTHIDAALRTMKAYSGERLPTLEGFAEAPPSTNLDQYRRGYFQYSVQLTPAGSERTQVRVCAKVTAWLEADGASSGYHELPSNGRLEADLFDRLSEALAAGTTGPDGARTNRESMASADAERAPDVHPSSTAAAPLTIPHAPSFPVTAEPAAPPEAAHTSTGAPSDPRIEKLSKQAAALTEILNAQSHPGNLVTVRRARTPVFDGPRDNARVVFLADAEDEFQRLNTAGAWTHVEISGLTRGWIRSALLEDQDQGAADGAASKETQPTEQVAVFPGKWTPLNGKEVAILSVPSPSPSERRRAVSAAFHKGYLEISGGNERLAGVVVVVDSAAGLMAAATRESLQAWNAGKLSEAAFWQQCYLDPQDAFTKRN